MIMKGLVKAFAVVVLGLLTAGPAAAEAEFSDPIKIALNDWSSQNVCSLHSRRRAEKLGYTIEYVQSDAMAQFAGLETGDITMQTEIWPTTQGARFAAATAAGTVADMGSLACRPARSGGIRST